MAKSWVSIDKRKYKTDSLSFFLAIIGLIANVFYFFTFYKNNNNYYYSYMMGISVLYNLIFMLIVFLAAEEIKNYRRPYSVLLFVIGLIQIFRIFFYPKQALDAGFLDPKSYMLLAIYLLISSVFLISSAVVSFWNSTTLKRYKEGKIILPQSDEV
ncbi:MAG: hypothetical protein PHX62_01020 [Bacilli bacterium]|nr:hypothetical protein [Bacilli bacterium]